jgi:hypothetical protein
VGTSGTVDSRQGYEINENPVFLTNKTQRNATKHNTKLTQKKKHGTSTMVKRTKGTATSE